MLPFTLLQQSGRQPETKGRCCDAVCFFYKVYFLGLCIHAVCLFTSLVCTVSTRGSLPLRNYFVYRANFTHAQAYTLLSVMANHFLRWERSQTGLTRVKQGHELLGFLNEVFSNLLLLCTPTDPAVWLKCSINANKPEMCSFLTQWVSLKRNRIKKKKLIANYKFLFLFYMEACFRH